MTTYLGLHMSTHAEKETRYQGRIQDFRLGGALKIMAPSGARHEIFGGISCEKSRFYAKKSYFFQFYGGRAPGAPPLWIRPWLYPIRTASFVSIVLYLLHIHPCLGSNFSVFHNEISRPYP